MKVYTLGKLTKEGFHGLIKSDLILSLGRVIVESLA